jgi:hypothetical protein
MPTLLNSIPYLLAVLTILLGVFTLIKEWNEYKKLKWLRQCVLVVLILVGGLTLVSLRVDQTTKEIEKLKAEQDIHDLKKEVIAAHTAQTDNTKVFLDRLGAMSTEVSNLQGEVKTEALKAKLARAGCPILDVLCQGWDSTDVSCLGFH